GQTQPPWHRSGSWGSSRFVAKAGVENALRRVGERPVCRECGGRRRRPQRPVAEVGGVVPVLQTFPLGSQSRPVGRSDMWGGRRGLAERGGGLVRAGEAWRDPRERNGDRAREPGRRRSVPRRAFGGAQGNVTARAVCCRRLRAAAASSTACARRRAPRAFGP